MLYLKELNEPDIEKEYECFRRLPENENGFRNPYCNIEKNHFVTEVFPQLMEYARGENLPEGWVPETDYFLWKDEQIVGMFRLRHYLNESLRNGAGHIGYCILEEHRGQGYATAGLKMVLEKAAEIIPEEIVYMSCHKNNKASLKVQMKNGASIDHEDDDEYYTRIKIK